MPATKVKSCSKNRVKQRRLLMADICHMGATAIEEGNAMRGRVCLEAIAELTKAGWPFKQYDNHSTRTNKH